MNPRRRPVAVVRRAARHGFWGEAFERDVALAEID